MKVYLAYGSPPPVTMERMWRDLGLYRRLSSFHYRKDVEQVVKVYTQERKA